MTIQDTHTNTHTLTHRENFSDGLTRLEAYVIPLIVITQLKDSHPLTNYTMMYVLFLIPLSSFFLPFFPSALPVTRVFSGLKKLEIDLMVVSERINLKKIPLSLLGSIGFLITTTLLGSGGVLKLLW